jgi:hypothetical protein
VFRLILLMMLFGHRPGQHTVEHGDNFVDVDDIDCECDDYDYDYPCDADLSDSYFNGD